LKALAQANFYQGKTIRIVVGNLASALLNPHAVFAIRSARISSGARHVLHDDRGIGGNMFPMLLE